MIMATKVILSILWLIIFFNWVIPFEGTTYTVLHWTGIILGVSHIVETFVFLPRAKLAGGSLPGHIIQLFLFGYVHNITLRVPDASSE